MFAVASASILVAAHTPVETRETSPCTRSIYDDAPSPTRAYEDAARAVFTVVSNGLDSTILLYSFDDPNISWAFMSPRHVIASHCTAIVPSLVGQLWAARKVQNGDPIEPGCGGEGAPRAPLRLATAVEGSEGLVFDDSVAYFLSQQERVVHLDGSRCPLVAPAAASSPQTVPSFFRLNVDVAAESMSTTGRSESRLRASLRLAFGHDPPAPRGVSRVVKGDEQATASVSVDLDNLLQPLTVIANYSADFACPACNYKEGIEGDEAAAADAAARRASQGSHARLPLIPCSLCGGTGRATAASVYHRAAFSMESTCPACKGVGAVTTSDAPQCEACSGERHVSEPQRTFHALIPAGAPSRLRIPADTARYDFLTLNLNVTPKVRRPPLADEEGGDVAEATLGPWARECEGASVEGSGANFFTEPAVFAALNALPLPDAVGCDENDGGGPHVAANVTVTMRTAALAGLSVRLGHAVPGASSDADWTLRLPPPVYPGDEAIILGAGLPVHDRSSSGGCLWSKIIPHPPPPFEPTRRDVADFLKIDCPRRVEEWINVSEALTAACSRAEVESISDGANVAVPLLRVRSRTFFCVPVTARRDVATLFPHGAVILRVRVALGASETLGLSSSTVEDIPGSHASLLKDEELATLIRALANAKAPQAAAASATAPTTGESVE